MDKQLLKYLDILDLEPGATYDDVKTAYRELALIWHPDKVPDRVRVRATRKFKQINEAYTWISQNPSVLERDWSGWRRTTTGETTGRTESRTDDRGILSILRGFTTDREAGVYVYPNLDQEKLINFVAHLTRDPEFPDYMPRTEDILVLYDIDGSGEEGMAITRTHHLVNNNVATIFRISELNEVKIEDAMFFWSQIFVRKKGDRAFQLAGYASKKAGRIFTGILNRILTLHPG